MQANKIGIVYDPTKLKAKPLVEDVERQIRAAGVEAWKESATSGDIQNHLAKTDIIICFGGDGTILRLSQSIIGKNIPIVGVNFGKVGFMAELRPEDVPGSLPAILAGNGHIEERSTLQADALGKQYYALNDVVISSNIATNRLKMDVYIDGEFFARYKAKGVIVATATGSTGYAFAAGGPILYPRTRDYAVVPVVPYSGIRQPMLIPEKSVITMRTGISNDVSLHIDGQIDLPLPPDTEVEIKVSEHKFLFLRLSADNYYQKVEQRLGKRSTAAK